MPQPYAPPFLTTLGPARHPCEILLELTQGTRLFSPSSSSIHMKPYSAPRLTTFGKVRSERPSTGTIDKSPILTLVELADFHLSVTLISPSETPAERHALERRLCELRAAKYWLLQQLSERTKGRS